MVESKLRVEIVDHENDDVNPFYGRSHHKFVIEDTHIKDKDGDRPLPPCGVYAKFRLEYETIEIKVDKAFFDGIDDGNCYVQFTHNTSAYELHAHFEDGKLVEVDLTRWSNISDFEDGQEGDSIYIAEVGVKNMHYCEPYNNV